MINKYICPECKGVGFLGDNKCYYCQGTGHAADEDTEEKFLGKYDLD